MVQGSGGFGLENHVQSFCQRRRGRRVNVRLLQLQGQGEGLARAEANLENQVGSDLFNARLGIGQQQAGLDIGLANALADSRQAGVNRLFDTVNAIGRVVAAF